MQHVPVYSKLLARLMQVFFQLLYQPFAWTYDFVAAIVSAGMWKSWVLTALPYLKSGRILELGHGPGHLQLAMRQKGVWSAGLDASPQMGRLAFLKLTKRNFFPLLVNGYAQSLPFDNRVFQQVVATFPSEYISLPQSLTEIFRVLNSSGELIIIPAAWITGRAPHFRILAWLFRVTRQAPSAEELHTLFDPTRGLSPAFVKPFLQAGFASVEAHMIEHPNSQVLLLVARISNPDEFQPTKDSLLM